jgi:hypothetical protein
VQVCADAAWIKTKGKANTETENANERSDITESPRGARGLSVARAPESLL